MSNALTADLIGFISIALVALMTFLIASRWPGISKIIFVALVMRVFLLLLGHYVVDLPDSRADAVDFENKAWFLAQGGFVNIINNFKGPESNFISWFIAIPYFLFGRSLLMAKSITLFFGIMSVFLVWKIALKIWDGRSANKAAWLITLFPSINLYSVILLREIYVIFFLLIAFNGIVNWVKTNNLSSIAWTMIGFIGGTFFHGGIFIGALIFLSILLKKILLNFMKVFLLKPVKLKSIYILVLITIFSGFYFTNSFRIPKIGYFKDGINLEKLYRQNEKTSIGRATYPEWLNIKSPEELFYKAPIRAIFFLFSPFPWHISSPHHLIGFFDGLFYLLLIFIIFRNRKMILQDRAAKYILLILIGYIFVFGLGVSNFGASIRHRSKFVIWLILIAAPFIPRIVVTTKKKIKKISFIN